MWPTKFIVFYIVICCAMRFCKLFHTCVVWGILGQWLRNEHILRQWHWESWVDWVGSIGMCYLEPPHIIVRKWLIAGIEYPLLAEHMSEFMARTLYFTSLLYRSTTEHKRAGVWTSIRNFVLLLYLACIIWSSPLWVFISQYDHIFLGYIYNCNWLWFKFCKVTSICVNV